MDRKEKLEMLRKRPEKRLTEEILIPLFEAMGFRNVHYNHGVLECGRDVIYCEETKFLKQKHIGVQVKSGDVDTKLAEKLFMQVARGVGGSFNDLADNNKEKSIDEFIVLCSGEIKENARENISSMLAAVHVDKPVSFIASGDLVGLLDEYMPSAFWDEYDYFNKYFNAMQRDFHAIKDVSAIGQKEPVRLERIYVSLSVAEETAQQPMPDDEGTDWKIFEERLLESEDQEDGIGRLERAQVGDAEKVSTICQRLVVVGAPGSGKTTLLKYLALKACRENIESQERKCVPVPITLRQLADSGEELRAYIDDVFEKYEFPEAKDSVEKDLKEGRCRLFLDGFDELATGENQTNIADQIAAFVNKYPRAGVIVTSRVAGYHDELKGFTKVELMDFDDRQIEKFIHNWFGERDPGRAKSMFGAIKKNEQIKALARNPLMIAIIAIIFEEDKELPQRRVDLYERCVEVLLSRWDVRKKLKNRYPPEAKEFMLRKLAFYGHANNRRILTQQEVLDEMARYFPQVGLQLTDSRAFLDEIYQRSYLLRQISMESYDFLHLSFQEYFTALELKDREDGISTIIQHLEEPWWEEPILLYAGISRDASALIKQIRNKVPEDIFHSNLMLFGKCIANAGFTEVVLRKTISDGLWSVYRSSRFEVLRNRAIEVLAQFKPDELVEGLIGSLGGRSALGRLGSATALGLIGSEKAIEPLVQTLATDADGGVRGRAASALGMTHRDEVVEPLMRALTDDQEGRVRGRAASALGMIADARAVEPLLQVLAGDQDGNVRARAASALGSIASREALEPLMEALANDSDSEVRQRAAYALRRLGPEDAVESLGKALTSDKDNIIRQCSAYVLGLIGGEKATEFLLEAIATDASDGVRRSAAMSLGRPGNEKAVGPLREMLATHDKRRTRMWAASALANIEGEKVLDVLVDVLQSDKTVYVRCWTASVLGAIGHEGAMGPLLEVLAGDDDAEARASAASALARIGSSQAVGPLLETLANDRVSEVRRRAACALARMRPEDAVKPLMRSLVTEEDACVRADVALALRQLGNNESLEVLIQVVTGDQDCRVRSMAASALGASASPKALKPLLEVLVSDEASDVRWNAACALGNAPGRDAISALMEALKDVGECSEGRVKDAAFAALEKISRRNGIRITRPEDLE